MAIVTRYFSTAAAGAGDGTTWANRAQLVSGATWSSVITGFAFNGSDSMLAYVGPGTHTYGAHLLASTITNPPTAANPLIFHGCDSSGNALTPPSAGWTSDKPVWDDSGYPVLASTGNFVLGCPNTAFRHFKATASGRNGGVFSACNMDWITIYQSTANTSAGGVDDSQGACRLRNVYVSMSGSSYRAGVLSPAFAYNVRVQGVAGSSGNRAGFEHAWTTTLITYARLCIFGVGGPGFFSTSGNAGQSYNILSSTIANCGGDGIKGDSTASQTSYVVIDKCMITGSGGYNINMQAKGNVVCTNNRMRDGTSGNINTSLLNYPTTFDNYTTDSDDATEYVDASSTFDFRIKSGATINGSGYGVSDQAATGSGGLLTHPGYAGRV